MRTQPTIPHTPLSKSFNPTSRWEIRVGLSQFIIAVALVAGFMVVSFYMGFFSGKSVGYSVAMDATIARSAKIPLNSERAKNSAVTDQHVEQMYARLRDAEPSANTLSEKGSDLRRKDDEPTAQQFNFKIADNHDKGSANAEPPAASKQKALGDLLPAGHQSDSDAAPAGDDSKINAALDEADADHSALEKQARLLAQKDKEAPSALSAQQPEKASAKVTPTPLPKTKISSGWYAQVAAPQKKGDADELVAKLKKYGFRATIENAQVRGESYFRVLVGPEDNKKQGQLLVSQLKRESYIKGEPLVRMIK